MGSVCSLIGMAIVDFPLFVREIKDACLCFLPRFMEKQGRSCCSCYHGDDRRKVAACIEVCWHSKDERLSSSLASSSTSGSLQ